MKNLYSPTMLVNYINYKHFITDEFDEKIFNLKKSEKTITENLRIEKGLDHEEEYFNKLKKKYKKVKNINFELENSILKLGRQFLHAKILGFIHPKTNEEMIFSSILPEELNKLLKILRNTNE